MKKILALAGALVFSYPVFSQDNTQKLDLRGPVTPANPEYAAYKSYHVTMVLHPNVESSIKSQKGVYSPTDIEGLLTIPGLKKAEKGDFEIRYTVTRFELLEGDNVDKTFDRSPCYYVGIESNMEVLDKAGKPIYKRYATPKVVKYVVPVGSGFQKLAGFVLETNFDALSAEFNATYLYGPTFPKLQFARVEKSKSSKSGFNEKEFNQSVAVFPAVADVDRANWPELFGEAQKYWKGLTEFTDAGDAYLQKRVRFASLYNLATSYLLTGQEKEAEKLLPAIREAEPRSILGRSYSPELENMLRAVTVYRKTSENLTKVDPIAAEPVLPSYKKLETAFRFAEFDGEVTDEDNKTYSGKIRVLSDSPELLDLRGQSAANSGNITLGSLFNNTDVENPTVFVYVADKKKPVRLSLKNIKSVKESDGHAYLVGKIGRGGDLFDASGATNTKRYALLDQLETTGGLTLFREFYPQEDFVLKRNGQDTFYTPPVFTGRRTSLTTFFNTCPAILKNVGSGQYDSSDLSTYRQLLVDYSKSCK